MGRHPWCLAPPFASDNGSSCEEASGGGFGGEACGDRARTARQGGTCGHDSLLPAPQMHRQSRADCNEVEAPTPPPPITTSLPPTPATTSGPPKPAPTTSGSQDPATTSGPPFPATTSGPPDPAPTLAPGSATMGNLVEEAVQPNHPRVVDTETMGPPLQAAVQPGPPHAVGAQAIHPEKKKQR